MKPTRANGLPIPRTLRLWFAVFRLLQAKEMVEQTDVKSGWVRTQRWTEYKTAARAAGELIDHRHRSGVVVFFAAELLFFSPRVSFSSVELSFCREFSGDEGFFFRKMVGSNVRSE